MIVRGDLISRHTTKHGIGPEGFLTSVISEIDNFFRHSQKLGYVTLKICLPSSIGVKKANVIMMKSRTATRYGAAFLNDKFFIMEKMKVSK